MGFLCFYGNVNPADYSEEIRRHGLTHRQARRLEHELVRLRKQEMDFSRSMQKVLMGVIAATAGMKLR